MIKFFCKLLIRLYQWTLSPLLGKCCRFYPSCSNYAMEAIETHGSLKGCYLTAIRLIKCCPWHPGGHDPVPPKESSIAFLDESNHFLDD